MLGFKSSSVNPGWQAGHEPLNPLTGTAVPRSQVTQGVVGSESASVDPAWHLKPEHGPLLPAVAKCPLGQPWHGVLELLSWSTVPAGHGPQAPNVPAVA